MAAGIYLAGKVSKHGWRHRYVAGLDLQDSDVGFYCVGIEAGYADSIKWERVPLAIRDTFDYVGPFFISCDHGCAHQRSEGFRHGMADAMERTRVLCLSAIKYADYVIANLDEVGACTAYGTLFELGYAHALQKPIILVGPGADDPELWFVRSSAVTLPTVDAALDHLERFAFWGLLESPIERDFWGAYEVLDPPSLTGLRPAVKACGGRYRIDFAIADRKFGIELDGYEYHSSREAFTKDRQRERDLKALGWTLIRFSGKEVKDDAKRCVTEAARIAASTTT